LSRLAAVQGSSLIVSLPRFIRRVERSEYNTRQEGKVVLSSATDPLERPLVIAAIAREIAAFL